MEDEYDEYEDEEGNKVPVDRIVLRKWDKKKDGSLEKGVEKPAYVIENSFWRDTSIPRGFSYAQSQVGIVNKLAQDLINNHNKRIQLICDSDEIGEDLYHAADSMVQHHNDLIDVAYPIVDSNPNPFAEKISRTNIIPQDLPTIKE